jgi:hypothetical protein
MTTYSGLAITSYGVCNKFFAPAHFFSQTSPGRIAAREVWKKEKRPGGR